MCNIEKDIRRITIDESVQKGRIDKALSLIFEDKSRSFMEKLIKKGLVSVNGIIISDKNFKVKAGDILEVEIPEPARLNVEAENLDLDVVYEDDHILIVNKPQGMVVHPSNGHSSGTLVNGVMYHCKDRLSSINGVIRPGIVHRIDKDTSGLLMIAKDDEMHVNLAKQLEEHSVNRRYKALVYNNFNEDTGVVDKPIGRHPKDRKKRAVNGENPKRAVTHYNVIERFGNYTLIENILETGRTHQIRVHMANVGHPLVGDSVYGPSNNPFGVKGQLLHAEVIGFKHLDGSYMEFKRDIPVAFQKVLNRLRNK